MAGRAYPIARATSMTSATLGWPSTCGPGPPITGLHRSRIVGCIHERGKVKQITADIRGAEADYLLAVKENQPTLHAEAAVIFDHCRRDTTGFNVDFHEAHNTGHGRTEVRRCWTTNMVESISQCQEWKGLSSLVLVESDRTVAGNTSTECRYYISSQKDLSARTALDAARKHWGIENELHWTLDVTFREDDCRVRAGNAAQNFAVMRHLSLNLLKSVKDCKLSIRLRRMRAAWDQDFILQVLTAQSDVG